MDTEKIPRRLYLSAQVRMATDVLYHVAREQSEFGEEELARALFKAISHTRRVARALDTDEPLLPE